MSAEPRTEVDVWGRGKCGLIRIRIHLDDDDWKTFWHVAIWEFTFGISFPAFIVRWFEK